MSLNTYDPKDVSIIVGGQIIDGFADGSFISIARDEDAFSLQVGSDGDATRSKSNNLSGTVTITLRQGSPSNETFSAFAAADELNNAGLVSFLAKSSSGTTLATAETSWVQKLADTEFAREAGDRAWIIRTDNLKLFVGEN